MCPLRTGHFDDSTFRKARGLIVAATSYYEGLAIYRAAVAIAVRVDMVARRFAKRGKYTLGSLLRDMTMDVAMLVARCNRRGDRARGYLVAVALEEPEACGNVKRRRLAYLFERPVSEQPKAKERP